MKLTSQLNNMGMNASVEVLAKMRRVSEIKTDIEFSGIFQIHEDVLKAVILSMKEKGYDKSQPVVIWKEKGVLVEGHTRLKAAMEAGIKEIPVVEIEFKSTDEAKRYCYKRQAERRNLTQAEIYAAATKLNISKKEKELAKELNVGISSIQHAKIVEKRGTEEDKRAIEDNKKTINEVYQKVRKPKHEAQKEITTRETTNDTDSFEGELDGNSFDAINAALDTGEDSADIFEEESIEKSIGASPHSDSSTEKFLHGAVIFLVETDEKKAAQLLINHFLEKNEIESFTKKLPQTIQKTLKNFAMEGGK